MQRFKNIIRQIFFITFTMYVFGSSMFWTAYTVRSFGLSDVIFSITGVVFTVLFFIWAVEIVIYKIN